MKKIFLVLILLGCGCATTETSQSQQGVKEEVNLQSDQELAEQRKQKFDDWQKKMRKQPNEQPMGM